MRQNFLEQFYTIDPDTGDYIIEIALISYDEIFNNWDSSVYNIRDLDASLKSFLEECSNDIDFSSKVTLRFNMRDERQDPETEKTVSAGLRNFFNYRLHFTRKKMIENRKKVLAYVLVSMVLTFFAFYLPTVLETRILHKIFIQGLQLGGWVFLWEAFTLLFLQGGATRKKRKEYERLLHAPIRFRYKGAR